MNFLCAFITTILSTQAATWNYNDFNQWTTVDPRCGNPKNQSPRNLKKASSVLSQQCKTLAWSNNKTRDFTIKNNGHGITMTPVLLPTETTANTFVWEGTTWCLEQFHFHWSQDTHGAEHRLENYDNGLEAHFVHRDCRFDNLTHALRTEQTSVGTINAVAVIGIMYQVDTAGDEILKNLLNNQVITTGVKESSGTSIVKALDYTHMLPSISHRSFYSYQGSLTTPTCDPVLWFVVESQEKVTAAELAILREIKDKSGAVMVTNQRPVQANEQTLHFYESCGAKPTTTTSKPNTTMASETPCPGNANAASTSSGSDRIEMAAFIGGVIGCLIGGLLIGAIVAHACVLNHMFCYADK